MHHDVDRYLAGFELLAEPQDGADRRQLGERFALRVHELPGTLTAARARRIEWKADGAIGEQLECRLADLDLGSFLHAAVHKTERCHRIGWWGRSGSGDAEVVGTCCAAADAHTQTATHQTVVGGAARHREVEVNALQDGRLPRAIPWVPAGDELAETVTNHGRLEGAAVEEDAIRASTSGAGLRARWLIVLAVPPQERGEIPRHLWV